MSICKCVLCCYIPTYHVFLQPLFFNGSVLFAFQHSSVSYSCRLISRYLNLTELDWACRGLPCCSRSPLSTKFPIFSFLKCSWSFSTVKSVSVTLLRGAIGLMLLIFYKGRTETYILQRERFLFGRLHYFWVSSSQNLTFIIL